MKILLSKAHGHARYALYEQWLKSFNDSIEILDASTLGHSQALSALDSCAGFIGTGGPDIHPKLYGRTDRISLCETIDDERDALEIDLIKKAGENSVPLLGICRGSQLLNVVLGGSLIADIQAEHSVEIGHRASDAGDSVHEVELRAESILKKMTKNPTTLVNSAHHQAVENLGANLMVSARANDGIIEAFEWEDNSGRGFLLGVQWHPERMDFASPLSGGIAERFLFEAESYSLLIRKT